MLNYLVVAPTEQKSDLCSKIADVMDKFAPTKHLHVDTVVRSPCSCAQFNAYDIRYTFIKCLHDGKCNPRNMQ